MAESLDVVGRTLGGRFDVLERVAAGGMGTVFRGRDRESGETVALKVVSRESPHVARFAREARTLSSLTHDGIVRAVAVGSDATCEFLAMEWLGETTLASRLRQGRLGVGETLQLGLRLSDALGLMHARGLVHRDLKPANVVLERGALERAKLIDFGLVAHLDAERETEEGAVLGTFAYMAPEQARGRRDLDARCDVFALGVLLYECLTGGIL